MHEEMGVAEFSWQEGYGAFTVGYREVEGVTRYIRVQEAHHQRIDFQSEYLRMLQANSVDYGREFVF